MKRKETMPKQIRYIMFSYIAAVALEYLMLPIGERSLANLDDIEHMSVIRIVLVVVLLWIFQNLIADRGKTRLNRWSIVFAFSIYATSSIINNFTWPFFAVCLIIETFLVFFAIYGWNGEPYQVSRFEERTYHWKIIMLIIMLGFLTIDCVWTVSRIWSLSTPTFDFGIFSQMFYYMKNTGRQLTTLERDGLLSHFSIHFSPIYYLMLPFYCMFPRVETLQVLQAVVLTSAVIPLWKIGKLYGLHPKHLMLICTLLLFYPAYSGGTSYDLHENCFLAPLLLWLLYGIDSEKYPMIAIFSILTVCVKEDAAVYVAVVALYFLLRSIIKKQKGNTIVALIMLLFSVICFWIITTFLKLAGEGIMNYRYENFMIDGSDSLVTVIKTVLICPMKAIYECVDYDKMKFIGLTIIPIIGLPLLTRRYERLILLIPYVLVNLMSDYKYQHDIMFQYTFGSTTCLFYLVTVNIADFESTIQKSITLVLALCISCTCFYTVNLPTAMRYINNCKQYAVYYENQRELLDMVPSEASVAATTFYTTYLSERDEIYDIRYSSDSHVFNCDYIVINVNESASFKKYTNVQTETGIEAFWHLLENNNYYCEFKLEGILEIYKKDSTEN